MAKRLVKVAKELNVGTSTIVEHLNKNGFEIENKPTAKITDEMYAELSKEFQRSIAIKEQADQLIIGTRPVAKKEPEPEKKAANPFSKPTPPPPPPPKVPEPVIVPEPVVETPPPPPPPVPAPEPVIEPEVIAPVEEVIVEKVEEIVVPKPKEDKPRTGLKILGKIDLDRQKKPKAAAPKPKKEEVKVEKEKPTPVEKKVEKIEVKKEEVKVEKEKPAPIEKKVEKKPVVKVSEKPAESTPTPTPKPVAEKPTKKDTPPPKPGDQMVRAKTPELRGLKILGKIDIKPKTPKKSQNKSGNKPGDGKSDDVKKRRRKRKKVPATGNNSNNSNNTGNRGNNTTGGNRTTPGNRNSPGNRGNSNRPNRGGNRGGNRSTSSRGRRPEVKEVSQKEIEEKIKATMARLQGGNKKKRQRLRREHRETTREKQEARELENVSTKLQLTEFVTVSELAGLMNVSATEVIMTCMNLGVIVSINQRLDAEIIELVSDEFGHEIEFISAEEELDEEEIIEDDPADLVPRAPIVTVMGHVDHGKTSLLDYIRKATVADGEAGGITQHIGAYEVEVGEEKKKITFLDTPGHEAFTAMRARGAKVTDVAIIIIAADDNIMPQTKEAISHAQAAGVPMVFAINKIDKDGASPDRIKGELAQMNLQVEEWGGKYQSQDISAKQGTNIDELLEKVLLEAELLDLKANPKREALGTVIEASLEKGRGYATKILVQNGTLRIGDPVVSGEHSGKIKAMFNERGKKIKEAGPATPVLVLGLSGAPQAGEKFKVVESEPEARQIATRRAQISREQSNRASKRISLDEIGRRLALGTFKELNLIVKGDVDGSIEALADSLIKQSIETVQVNIIHKAVGQIIESDVLLASASDAIIIGFQVRPSLNARKLAEREGVEIKMYSIIYEAIEEIRSAIEGMLEPTKEEKITSQVEVREVYKISKIGTVAGCYVQEGKIGRNNHIRLVRNGIVIYPTKEGVVGEMASLKRYKDDIKEVKFGMECGISIKNYNDIKVGDTIESYEIVEVKQTLDSKR